MVKEIVSSGKSKNTKNYQLIIEQSNKEYYYRLSYDDIGTKKTVFKTIKPQCPNVFAETSIIYPNPLNSDTKLFVKIPNDVKGEISIIMFDMAGKQILSKFFNAESDSVLEISLEEETKINKGIYLVKINFNGTNQTKKLVVY